MDAPVECVMLECGHLATCTACGKRLNECPICRQYVVRVVRTFKAWFLRQVSQFIILLVYHIFHNHIKPKHIWFGNKYYLYFESRIRLSYYLLFKFEIFYLDFLLSNIAFHWNFTNMLFLLINLINSMALNYITPVT